MAIQAQNFTTTPVEPTQPQQPKKGSATAPKTMKMDNMGNVEPIEPQPQAPAKTTVRTVGVQQGKPQTQVPAQKTATATPTGTIETNAAPVADQSPSTEAKETPGVAAAQQNAPDPFEGLVSDLRTATSQFTAYTTQNPNAAGGAEVVLNYASTVADSALRYMESPDADPNQARRAINQALNTLARQTNTRPGDRAFDERAAPLLAALRTLDDMEANRLQAEQDAETERIRLEKEAKEQETQQQYEGLYNQQEEWQRMASGEGLDDTAAQQQLAENVARARDNTQDQLSGFGGRQSARAANIGATMDARQQAEASRAADLLRTQEQQYYQQLAGELSTTLSQELANADFADAEMRGRMAEVYSHAMNSAKDISNSLEVADLMAEAQRKMAEDQASAGWTSTIIGGALSGAATGASFGGGPWGALIGAGVGAGAGLAGKYFSGN